VRDTLLGRDSKDADFLVPATDIAGLTATLEAPGRTEELVVAHPPLGERPPARATVEVATLPARALVEIEASALI
jgi:enamine deaminase RidA (YjgF/YER057c/UK114 family)